MITQFDNKTTLKEMDDTITGLGSVEIKRIIIDEKEDKVNVEWN